MREREHHAMKIYMHTQKSLFLQTYEANERSFDVYAIIMLFLQRNYAHIKYAIELIAEKTLLSEVKELLKS